MSTGILKLPYDLLWNLYTYLPADSIAYFLSTCKDLRAYYEDENLWKRLSATYGVTDSTLLGTYSWRTVYTTLLHTYGPLLGLHASDEPTFGGLMEFRFAKQKGNPCIIAEIWMLSEAIRQKRHSHPSLPEYYLSFTIRLEGDGTQVFKYPSPSDFEWFVHSEQRPWWTNFRTQTLSTPSFVYRAPSNHSIYYHYRHIQTPLLHPEFPSDDAMWFDRDRPLPRLKQDPAASYTDSRDRFSEEYLLSIDSGDYIFARQTDHINPPAFSIKTPAVRGWYDPLLMYRSARGVLDIRDFSEPERDDNPPVPARYYPLRAPSSPSGSPLEGAGTHPSRYDGVWLGAGNAWNTHVFYIAYDATSGDIKVERLTSTGDVPIPRGIVNWTLDVHATIDPQTLASVEPYEPGMLYTEAYEGTVQVPVDDLYKYVHRSNGRLIRDIDHIQSGGYIAVCSHRRRIRWARPSPYSKP
ncbi:hypothetical protein K474DRAFT_489285 [Panus rudis PR-1116 ss-1]|nr:hypothetical protein K474DRAFT_489285 [Panus rudis PR-1116 ss-1]